MEEDKKEKKNTLVIVLIIIAVIIIATGIICSVVMNKPSEPNKTEKNEETEKTDTDDDSDSTVNVLKEKYDFTINLFEDNVYCGESPDSSAGMNFESNLDGIDKAYFIASTQFKTYDELLKYVNQYMTNEIFSKHWGDISYYRELDNKLYCHQANRGITHQYNSNKTVYNIVESDENKIVAKVISYLDPYYYEDAQTKAKSLSYVGSKYEQEVTMTKTEETWQISNIVINECECIDDGYNLCDSSKKCSYYNDLASQFGNETLKNSLIKQ